MWYQCLSNDSSYFSSLYFWNGDGEEARDINLLLSIGFARALKLFCMDVVRLAKRFETV